MDQLASKSLLLLLAFLGSSAGQAVPTLDALRGGNVTLKTSAPIPPYNVLIWAFSDGTNKPVTIVTVTGSSAKVQATYQGRASVDLTTGSLTLTQLKPEDSGDYTVNVVPIDGDATADDTKLRVLEPVSDVLIASNLPEPVEFNSTVILNCSAKGSLLRFDWFNGSSPLVVDAARMALAKDRTSSALTIRAVLRTDLARPVYCEASNSLQRVRSNGFNLTVFYGPDAVVLVPSIVPQFISSASSFNLSCGASSSPPATFTWYQNQAVVAAGPVLTLQALRDQGLGPTAGNYTCVGSNAKTLRSVASPVATFTVMDPISDARISGPTATLIAGNSSANLSCQAAAGSVASRAWLKDGQPLGAGPRLALAADGSSLLISPLQKEDAGEYHCHLKNPVSFAKASYRILVNFGPEQAKVTGVNKVKESDKPVTLSCSAASVPPANFTWKHNGSVTTTKTEAYTIQKPSWSDSGTYTCEASNGVTGRSSTASHTLLVTAYEPNGVLSDGAIAGIVVGVLVAICAAIAVTIYCRQKVPVESPY